jgi:hypothetical protein
LQERFSFFYQVFQCARIGLFFHKVPCAAKILAEPGSGNREDEKFVFL